MTVRASVFQRNQVGVESTPGTAVDAGIQLASTRIEFRPRPGVQPFRTPGNRFNVDTTLIKEFAEFDISAETICYRDLIYLFGAGVKASGGATTATYLPSPTSDETLDTLTIEQGNSVRAERVTYGVVSGLSFQFPNQGVPTLSGAGFGRLQAEGITMTSSPTVNPSKSVNGKDVTVQFGSSVGGLTTLPKPLLTEFGWDGMYKPGFYLNSDPSFTEHVPLAPNLTARVVAEYGSDVASYLTDLRAATQRFCRILCTNGTQILRITFPFHFLDPEPGDQEDVYAINFALQPSWESNFGGAFELYVVS